MITANQIVCHLIGDYILQSDWMATEKTKKSLAALWHVLTYALPFVFLRPSFFGLVFIVGSHFVIDRWRLARFVVFAKNRLAPVDEWATWSYSKATGYPRERPDWMAVWLLIIADNTMHLLCNGFAMTYL